MAARLVVLVSGSGTNLGALLEACTDPSYGAEVVAVGADRDNIEGLDRAERLGITYKELAAALMNTGSNLGVAVMPLSLAARVRRGPKGEIIVEPRNSIAALVAKFGGRLFLLGDIDAVPGLTDEERAEFLSVVNRTLDGKVEAIGWGHDGPALRALLKSNGVPHQEAFLIGAGMGHQVLGEAAGLPFTKDIDSWFSQ